MTDPRIAKLRAKAADSAVTPEEAKLYRDKAAELEVRDAARVPAASPVPKQDTSVAFSHPWLVVWDSYLEDIIEAGYMYDEDEDF